MYGSFAAAAGGVTTALEMPFNADPPTRNADLFRLKRQAIETLSIIDIGLWGLLENNNLKELEAMHIEGAIGFKAFLCDPGGMFGWLRTADLINALKISKQLGNIIGVHAEDEGLCQFFTQRVKESDFGGWKAWSESRPPEVEMEAIRQAILATATTGGDLHIVHTTIPDGFAAIQKARAEGIRVTGETCPHYLFFSNDELERIGPEAKCGPPLRSPETVHALWKDVLADRVDIIGSDHCPCLPDMKTSHQNNIWQTWGGISGIQAMLPVLLTDGYHRRGLPLTSIVRMTSLNPARRFGLYPKKGHLGPGSDADLVVVDLNKEWVFSEVDILSRHKLSPYRGARFKGAVVKTFVRGCLVYENGKILAHPGYGTVLRRSSQADIFKY
jgi:allantoinase